MCVCLNITIFDSYGFDLVSETSMEAAFEAINDAPRIYIYMRYIFNYCWS